MPAISTSRHEQIFNPVLHAAPVSIIGAGATGSRVFMTLVELGITDITVFDFDRVEPHNLANQIYGASDLDSLKVNALASAYHRKTGEHPPKQMTFHPVRLPNPEYRLNKMVFLLTDTMSSRREIFENCLENNPNVYWVIETRMAATHGNIFQFDPCDKRQSEAWLNSLIDDDQAEISACGTSLSVGATASVIANMAVWQYIHYLTNPEALDTRIDIHLKPLVATARRLC